MHRRINDLITNIINDDLLNGVRWSVEKLADGSFFDFM